MVDPGWILGPVGPTLGLLYQVAQVPDYGREPGSLSHIEVSCRVLPGGCAPYRNCTLDRGMYLLAHLTKLKPVSLSRSQTFILPIYLLFSICENSKDNYHKANVYG